jgi:hypothetical protein
MRRSGLEITVASLMVAVAIAAVDLAAPVDVAHVAMIGTIAACIAYLAYNRYSEAVSRNRTRGVRMGSAQKAGVLLSSITLAMVVVGLSDLAFLIGYYGFLNGANATVRMSHWSPYIDPAYIATGGVFGSALALWVAWCLRRAVYEHDRTEPWRTRRWLKLLWPVLLVIVVGAVSVGHDVWERYWICMRMADYHDTWPMAEGPRGAAAHAWLKQWYKDTAIRPWLPVHPEHVPPEPTQSLSGR